MNKINEILECLEKYGKLTPDAIDDLHYIRDYITNLQEKIDKAIEYIKENEKEYGSLEDNEKIILNILKGEDDE